MQRDEKRNGKTKPKTARDKTKRKPIRKRRTRQQHPMLFALCQTIIPSYPYTHAEVRIPANEI